MNEITIDNIVDGVLYDSIVALDDEGKTYLQIAVKLKNTLILVNIPNIEIEKALSMNNTLRSKCLIKNRYLIKYRVTGECPSCKFMHNNTKTVIIQVDGKYIYLGDDKEGPGFAQCVHCTKPLPYKKEITV